jgi:hypothetical protein
VSRGLGEETDFLSSHVPRAGDASYMVAFSGSRASLECVRAAAEVCGILRKDLLVAWVADLSWLVAYDQPIVLSLQALTHEQEVEENCRRVANALANATCPWQFITRVGFPSAVLAQMISDNSVEVVFVGPSRAATRWFGRSVPRGLADSCPGTEIVRWEQIGRSRPR